MIKNDTSQLLLVSLALIVVLIIVRYFYQRISKNKTPLKPIEKNTWTPILEKEFPYYNKLSEENKSIFLEKLSYFYEGKIFIAKQDFEIDERKKILICASAAQLTFGLPLLKLSHFQRILISRESKNIKALVQHTHSDTHNDEGRVYFSWEEIQLGFDDPTDGSNPALHKLAEALLYEDGKLNEEYHFIEKEYLEELFQLFIAEKKILKFGKHPFLNKTAGESIEDFFAISVESFFERPLLMKAQMPNLYRIISGILNQDTAQLEETINASN